jgi:hypothetical protein
MAPFPRLTFGWRPERGDFYNPQKKEKPQCHEEMEPGREAKGRAPAGVWVRAAAGGKEWAAVKDAVKD